MGKSPSDVTQALFVQKGRGYTALSFVCFAAYTLLGLMAAWCIFFIILRPARVEAGLVFYLFIGLPFAAMLVYLLRNVCLAIFVTRDYLADEAHRRHWENQPQPPQTKS